MSWIRKIAAAVLLLTICLSGCVRKEAAQESTDASSAQGQQSSCDTTQETEMEDVFEFLKIHVDLEKKIEQDGFSYRVSEGKRGNAAVDYFIVSIGTNSAEKFTALEHYYIRFDFSEIKKSNSVGEDIVMWKSTDN